MVFGRRIEGTRLLGVVLLGFAVLSAAGTFHRPAATAAPSDSSSAGQPDPAVAIPRPLAPIGTVDGALPAFSWDWQGPEPATGFEVVLFDDEFRELLRTAAVRGRSVDPSACGLSAQIAVGARRQWCVQLAGRPETRSAPMPVRRR